MLNEFRLLAEKPLYSQDFKLCKLTINSSIPHFIVAINMDITTFVMTYRLINIKRLIFYGPWSLFLKLKM